ncbi:hypothetical protein BJF90_35430 [Pseudonocardia sp. CNS-004]|nr:hypothetical protein BJF90_35430 [Pseudonocardia sp. CNS-004]
MGLPWPRGAAVSSTAKVPAVSWPERRTWYRSPRKGITRWVSGVVIAGVTTRDAGLACVPVMARESAPATDDEQCRALQELITFLVCLQVSTLIRAT